MSATPVATHYTHAFVRRHLPDGARSILEIGCGEGELAARLAQDGFDIFAIDSDEAAVASARGLGVDARLQAWPAEVGRDFDALLFTRSLHHVQALDEAVAAAELAVRPGGRVVVEDFRAEGGSERSRDWYRAMVRELANGGAFKHDTDTDALLSNVAPSDHHEHQLHSSDAIAAELGRRFAVIESDAAYYFRYLEPHLAQDGAAKWLLEIEQEQIAAGAIDPLGKRFVCVRA